MRGSTMASNYDHNEAASYREARPLRPNQNQFERNFEEAIALSEGTSISQMDRQDVQLMNKMLHEKAELLATSCRFHYIRLGELYNIPREDLRMVDSAEEVLGCISAKQEDELTVAELLKKMKGTRQCYDVVRKLVAQIVKRGQNNQQ